MRAVLTIALLATLATPAFADDNTGEHSFWQRVVAWFQPADVQSADAASTVALTESIPPAPAGYTQNAGQAVAGNTPATPRTNAFADPLLSPEDLSAIAPAAGDQVPDLSKGFEDPAPALAQ